MINIKITKKEVKDNINKFFNSIGFPIIIGIILLLKTIFFYTNTISIREQLDMNTILGTILFLAIITCIICVLPNRGRISVTIIIDLLISLLLFADNAYHTYSSSVLSVEQITNLQYGEEIIDTLPMLGEFKQIIYFIDILIICLLLAMKYIKIEKKSKINTQIKIAKITIGIVGVMLFGTIGVDYIDKAQEDPLIKICR